MSLRSKLRRRLHTRLRHFQRKGVEFLEEIDGRGLNCDDMGLGKTIQTIGLSVIHPEWRPVIVVCPATIKYHWQREWRKHAHLRSYICDGKLTTKEQDQRDLEKKISSLREEKKGYLLRRSILAAKRNMRVKGRNNKKKIREARRFRNIIINYDILESWLPFLISLHPKFVIIDECHYVMNQRAKRTKACRQLARSTHHVVGLSGTPVTGKPAEFFPILNMVRPKLFPSFWRYAFQFCAPKRNRWSGSWDFSGASNLDALREVLKRVMIRRMKRKVLKELPKKSRTIIPVEIDNRKEYEEAEQNFLSWLLKKKGKQAWDRASRAEAIVRLNGLKQLTAEGKLNTAVKWIRDFMEETDQKLIVFAIHKAVLRRLEKEFPKAITIDGSVSSKPIWKVNKKGRRIETSQRQMRVDQFQNDPQSRLLLGQLKAAGQGLNLTSANNILFLELGWTPGSHDQAEDRVLRIGQKLKVSIYYMIGKGTVEEKILTIIQAKDETVSHLLDGRKGGVMRLLNLFIREQRRKAG